MALDDADKAFIAKLMAESFKGDDFAAAIGGVVKREIGSLKLDDKFKAVDEKIGAVKPKDKSEDVPDDKGKPAKGDPAVAAQLAALQKQLTEEKEARTKAEDAKKLSEMVSAAKAALGKAGVPEARIAHAIAVLHNAEGRVKLGEDGSVGLHFKREGYEELVPIEKGVAEWLKGTDGKAFLPAVGSAGTGEGAGRRPTVTTADGKLDENALRNQLAAKLGSAPHLN